MKDLPTKLAAKIPKLQSRDDSDDYTDTERPECDREDSHQANKVRNSDSPSRRERLLLEKIDYLTQKLEAVTRGEARTSVNRSTRLGSQAPMRSSMGATPLPSQDAELQHSTRPQGSRPKEPQDLAQRPELVCLSHLTNKDSYFSPLFSSFQFLLLQFTKWSPQF